MTDPPRRCVCGHTWAAHIPGDITEPARTWPCQLMVCDCRQFDEGCP